MRRRAGIGAVHKQKLEQEKYRDKGSEIQENQLEQMTKQMEVFRTRLEEFAGAHRAEIKKDATFRKQFQEMCASIGVDPLASGKGFWSVLNLGDFYYELSVQIVEVCLATSDKNGGLIGLDELRTRLIRARGKKKEHQEITNDDLLRAAKKLKSLGTGFAVLSVGGGLTMVQSVPGELSLDETSLLGHVSRLPPDAASVSASSLRAELGWAPERAAKVLDRLVREGLAWIDSQPTDGGEPLYWFPSFFKPCIEEL